MRDVEESSGDDGDGDWSGSGDCCSEGGRSVMLLIETIMVAGILSVFLRLE